MHTHKHTHAHTHTYTHAHKCNPNQSFNKRKSQSNTCSTGRRQWDTREGSRACHIKRHVKSLCTGSNKEHNSRQYKQQAKRRGRAECSMEKIWDWPTLNGKYWSTVYYQVLKPDRCEWGGGGRQGNHMMILFLMLYLQSRNLVTMWKDMQTSIHYY